ncbi:restriction endonuclease subunit S [Vibrio parahaemolyticus]
MSNLVPEGWSLRNLGSTLDVLIAGQSPNRKEFSARLGAYGILKTTAIDWGRFYPQHNQEVLDDFKPNLKHEVAVDDILITKAGPAHRVGVVAHVKSTPSKILVSGKMTLMRVKQGYVSSFIAYALSTEYSQKPLKESTTGMASSQTNFTHDTLKEIPIVVPNSKNEQKKIAAILTSVDDVIEKTQAQIDKLKELKTGMMQELLTSGVGVDGKPHTEFKDSPVGPIPKGWEVAKLDEVAVIQTGAAKSSKLTGDLVELPYLRVANVQDGYLDLSEIKTIKVPKSKSERFLLRENDVLVNEGGDFDKLGRGSIWSGQISPCAHQNHVFVVRTNTNKLNPNFFNHLSGSEHGKKYYMGCAKQTTNLASINSSQLKQFPVLLPSLEEQVVICQVLNSIDENISKKQAKLAQNRDLKKALMQDLLTGKVRVKVED